MIIYELISLKKTKMLEEFKKFLIKRNMVDIAVGFIFGGAFATVVMPPVGLLMGRADFSQLYST